MIKTTDPGLQMTDTDIWHILVNQYVVRSFDSYSSGGNDEQSEPWPSRSSQSSGHNTQVK